MNHELLVDCRLRAATELLSHAWDPVVLAGLRGGPRRRSDLRRLHANGLVERRRYPAAPPRVEYRLSALGVSLVEGPLRELGQWIAEHGDELLEAQERAARPAHRT